MKTQNTYPLLRSNYLFILALCPVRWHRVAYSVQGKFVTLFLDCQRVETMDLLRGDNAEISTEGVTVFGTRLLDSAVFEVGLCQRAGVHFCISSMPLLTQTLLYSVAAGGKALGRL